MAPSKLQISPENAKYYPCLTFCSPKLLQILSPVYCLLPPPPATVVCPGGRGNSWKGGGGGFSSSRRWGSTDDTQGERVWSSLGRQKVYVAWASGNTYSLDITLPATDVSKRQMLTTILLNCITSCFQNFNFHKSLN
jgi:hypothetical protein